MEKPQKQKGIIIHAIDCDNLENLDDNSRNWLDLSWPNGDVQNSHPTSLTISMYNGVGVLGRICSLIGERGANITNIERDLQWQPQVSIKQGVAEILKNIDYWREAPVWTPDKIATATQDWFRYLGRHS